MGTWKNRINVIRTEGSGSYDADKEAMDLLFCFSQVNEKSEDWKDLTAKADQFMRKDGAVNQVNATRIEKVLNDWATGKNSPLRGSNNPDVLRFSAPSYLFRGYNAMKQFFTSIGFNLEENLPKLKPEAKECAKKVDSASAQPAKLPSTEEESKNLRNYITKEYMRAFYFGVELRFGQTPKPVDPYLNKIGPARDTLDCLDEFSRKKIDTMISESYNSVKDSKKWYGKDDETYTRMMEAVRGYTDTHRKEAGNKEISADEKEKLEKAITECSRYVEKNDGIKFTSVGQKRLDAAKKMLEMMKKLPEAREINRKLASEKAAEKAKQRTEEKLSKLAKERTEKKHQEEKKAPKKPVSQTRKKPAGPVDREDEWFRIVSALMRQEKAIGNGFQRMDKVMEQYKNLTAKDQARVHDMWVKQYEMGEDTWKMLKERNQIKEIVPINFRNLKKEEEKENPKMSRISHKVIKEPEKEAIQKKKESKSL